MSTRSPASDSPSVSRIVHDFRVMGVAASIVCTGATDAAVQAGVARLQALEDRWSRFKTDSDVSRLNAADGAWCAVSQDTIALVTWMVAAHTATSGFFDPTLLPATVALGDSISRTEPRHRTTIPRVARAGGPVTEIEVDPDLSMIRLPREMALDPGGIAKGLAADMVAAEIMGGGASGCSVNIGGDLRCAGDSGHEGGWLVHVMSGLGHDVQRWTISVRDGGVATSSTLARRWETDDEVESHHIIDPATHRPLPETADRPQLATVVASSAAWAEVFTKAVLVAGWDTGLRLVESRGMAAAILTHGGCELANNAWRSFTP